jgi:5'(3')-deoxyribonucleotidase
MAEATVSNVTSNSRVARFVLGVDLDGVCADAYGKFRELFAEWRGVEATQLATDVTYGLTEWGMLPGEYERFHRFAVTQRDLFLVMQPIRGSAQTLRRLSAEGIRIRIITNRLYTNYLHQIAVSQTVQWLDKHDIPFSDLCFMSDKAFVDADMYVDDAIDNVRDLEGVGRDVITFTNSTNVNMDPPPRMRAHTWSEVEDLVRARYYGWRRQRGLALPAGPGWAPLGDAGK